MEIIRCSLRFLPRPFPMKTHFLMCLLLENIGESCYSQLEALPVISVIQAHVC